MRSAVSKPRKRPSSARSSVQPKPRKRSKGSFKELALASNSDRNEESDKESEEESEEESEVELEKESESDEESDANSDVESDEERNREADKSDSELLISDQPMNFDDVLIGMWVVVQYEGEKFIGIVDSKNENNGEYMVRCLEKPYGIREAQSYENGSAICYSAVYETSAIPTPTRVGRKWLFTY